MNTFFDEPSQSNLIAVAVAALVAVALGVLGAVRVRRSGAGAKLQRSVDLAVKSLWLHKLRSFLSVLGIIIGTSSVIALMAFGEGSMQDALEDIRRQGATNIIVRSVKPSDDSATATRSWVTTYGLVKRDLERIDTIGDSIVRVVPLRVFPTEARFLERLVNARVIGTTPEYADVHKLELSRGRFLMPTDDRDRKNVCVLGAEAADKLFPFEDPVGRSVLMRTFDFTVVGVVRERMPTGGTGGSQAAEEYNRDIYLPLNTTVARFGEVISVRSSGSRVNEKVQYNQVTITVSDIDKVRPVGDSIKAILEQEHGAKRDWAVTIPLDKLEEAERAKNRFLTLMAMIASISLLVGGIGIMNIMLATVTERTREIGIRRALGAKQKDITLQFLVEAVVQTTVGGLCGVVLGIVMVFLVPFVWGLFAANPLPAKVHVPAIFMSLFVSVGVGVLFGWYPARRAARLDPIEALRHD
ncbi:ABC transporter permease [Gemmata sp.]|uniref:ABC transporter permease n=1 Tax=Gemmata sp. TaxID=1914242 RepID=UPI003F71D1EF